MLTHGGKLRNAARRYGIPLNQWLDLSTGVNPRCYPVPSIPTEAWNRLPEDDDGLIDVAREYFKTSSLLPVAGSQAAIQALPIIRRQLHPHSRVAVLPVVGYQEHRHAWQKQGFTILTYDKEPDAQQLAIADVVVIINPNNPTGHFTDTSALMDYQTLLSERDSWLIVDEAFMDATPELSISPKSPLNNLIILRSIGKFFGLAGIRAGFVLAEPAILKALQEHLGPWCLSTPAREVCKAALADKEWQESNRNFLERSGSYLSRLLSKHFAHVKSTHLFSTVFTEGACAIHEELCQRGIFTRLLDEKNGIRFGLIEREEQKIRLEKALTHSIAVSHPDTTGVSR